MQLRLNTLVAFLASITLVSCNIYSPFAGDSSDTDYLEAALDCLHDGDYDCAIAEYNKLGDSNLKNQKLCTAYLSKSGFTLNAFLNVVTNSDNLLGNLANSLLEQGQWSSSREDDTEKANGTYCKDYADANTTDDTAQLFRSMAALVDCAMRIAKTDQYVADSAADSCEISDLVAGDASGTITDSDVSEDGSGSLAAAKGMCASDVDTCNDNIQTAVSANSGLNLGSASAINDLPAGLTGSATTDATRAAILTQIAN